MWLIGYTCSTVLLIATRLRQIIYTSLIFDRWCADEYGKRFAQLDPHERHRVVATLQEGGSATFDDGGKAFFEHAKQLTVFGYYTSEIGMTIERRYLPVPGRFDGAYPYAEVGTLFTS